MADRQASRPAAARRGPACPRGPAPCSSVETDGPPMCGLAHAVEVHGAAPGDRTATAHRCLAVLPAGLRAGPDGDAARIA
ncbi:hypothetical protein ACIRBX_17260 [Kitasatospora sp. NPDC096147]|uniref:hypothetical protein n=1 Tax=Kitasatospora sp. NPDC096147 TaxID=3364093 RepID=UPI003813D0F1